MRRGLCLLAGVRCIKLSFWSRVSCAPPLLVLVCLPERPEGLALSLSLPLRQGRAILVRPAWLAVIGEHAQLWVTFGGVLGAAAFFLLEAGVPGAQCVPFGALSGVLASGAVD